MSEATLEAPETQQEPVNPRGSVTIDLDNLFEKKEEPKEIQKVEEKEAPKEAAKEAPKDEKKPEQKPAKANDPATNLGAMRKTLEEKEAALAERMKEIEALRAEHEALKSKPIELPDDVKGKLSAVEKLEKEFAETRAALRQADLSRDPDFRAKYQNRINSTTKMMVDIASAAGIPKDQIQAAFSNWNVDAFAEWADSMTPGKRLEFQAAMLKTQELYQEQQLELQNAETTYEKLNKERQEYAETQRKQILESNEKMAKEVVAEVMGRGNAKDFADLQQHAEAVAMQVARFEMPPRDVIHNAVANQLLARVTKSQSEKIEELQKQLDAQAAKLKEQEEFIASRSGAVPRGGEAGKTTQGDVDEDKPIWEQVVVRG